MRATDEKKKSFILYDDYRSAFESLSDNDAGELIKAIFRYNAENKKSNTSQGIRAVYELITSRMKTDREKYIEKCERMRTYGESGGRPKKP